MSKLMVTNVRLPKGLLAESRTLSPHPPKALRQSGVRLDNLTIVPASLLPQRASYQAYANRLPRGQVLIIVPHTSPSSRRTLAKVAASLEANGHRVRTLPVERFRAAAPPTPHRR